MKRMALLDIMQCPIQGNAGVQVALQSLLSVCTTLYSITVLTN